MQIDLIGLLTFAAGIYILWAGPKQGFALFAFSTLLGAAAAVKLPSLAGASIMPAHVALGFFALSIMMRPAMFGRAVAMLAPGRTGFWMLAIVLFGLTSALFLPRIFYGATQVYSVARSPGEQVIVILPLKPGAGNLTQSVYLVADLLAFAAIAAYASVAEPARVAKVLLATAALSLCFVLLDFATYAAGTSKLLDVIRNANYRMLNDTAVGGFKRVVGSFTETSTYSYVTLGYLGFTMSLWLEGVWTRVTLPLTAVILLTLIMSTSGTAYGSLAVFGLLVFVGAARQVSRGRATTQQALLVTAGPPALALLLLGLALIPAVWQALSALFDSAVVNKLDSQSGVERAAWNAFAWRAFLDTWGFGGGIGSVRSSSLVMAVLANVGTVGGVLYTAFLWSVVKRARSRDPSPRGVVSRAAAAGAGAMLIAAVISTGGTDLGLSFFLLAGVACAGPARSRAAARPAAAVRRVGPPELLLQSGRASA